MIWEAEMRTVLLLLATFILVHAYQPYQGRIPNGDRVPHPCLESYTWHGVGHVLATGGGARNQFGLDFLNHDKEWTKELCMLDSDEDGRTNGEELGDPDCLWTPEYSGKIFGDNKISHPGVCEPFHSKKCRAKNSWVNCKPRTFDCDPINDKDVQNFTVHLPPTKVPPVRTSHYCTVMEFPTDGDFHNIATDTLVDKIAVLHHIVIFACTPPKTPEHAVGESYRCDVGPDPSCPEFMYSWLLGGTGVCYHDDAGIRVGPNGYRYAVMQLHFENTDLRTDIVESSGVVMYLTPNLRQHDAAWLMVGQEGLTIPPGQTSYPQVGSCPGECTAKKMKDKIYVTFAYNHMHYTGRAIAVDIYRQNKFVQSITNESQFQYDNYKMYTYEEPIVIHPGDEVRTTCVFQTTSRDGTTVYGNGYLQEMCYGVLVYHPYKAIDFPHCSAFGELSWCDVNIEHTTNQCNMQEMFNFTNPAFRAIYDRVMKYCKPLGPCYDECIPVVKALKEMPCFQGDLLNFGRFMGEWSLFNLVRVDIPPASLFKLNQLYAALNSCDGRIAELGETNAGLHLIVNMVLIATATLVAVSTGSVL